MTEPTEGNAGREAAGERLPLSLTVLSVCLVAMLLDLVQVAVFPCKMGGCFAPAVGFVFFFSGLLFLVFVRRKESRLLSLIPLAVSVLTALPWFVSHVCG